MILSLDGEDAILAGNNLVHLQSILRAKSDNTTVAHSMNQRPLL